MKSLALAGAVALGVGSCIADEPGPIPVAEARDSAGIRIVENGHAEQLSVFRVADRPVFRTGWKADEPTLEVIRGGALRSDGSAAVFDDGAKRLYLISPSGEILREVGREGDGPGEFRSGDAVEVLADDRILVSDYMAGRLSLFDSTGEFVDSELWTYRGAVGSSPAGAFSDDRVGWISSSYAPSLASQELDDHWVFGPLLASDPLGGAVDTLAVLPMVELRLENGRPIADPFTRYSSADVYSDGFVWARNDLAEVVWLSREGAVLQRARWGQPPRQVDERVWEEYEAAFSERLGRSPERATDDRAAERLRNARRMASPTLPLFRYVRADRDGAVWISSYTMVGLPSSSFLVIDAHGVARTRIEFPRPVEILDIRDNRLLGVETNEWGVQAVALYRVER